MTTRVKVDALRHRVLEAVCGELDGAARTVLEHALPAHAASPLELWMHVQQAICDAVDSSDLRSRLLRMRSELNEQLAASLFALIDAEVAESSARGHEAWVACVAEAVANYQTELATRLCRRESSSDATQAREAESIRSMVACTGQARWAETYDLLDALSRRLSVPVQVQARLRSMVGQIHVFIFADQAGAKIKLDEAVQLAPRDARVESAFGDYWSRENVPERARECFGRAIRLEPALTEAYVGIARLCSAEERKLKLEEAIQPAGGAESVHHELMLVLGAPGQLESNAAKVRQLADTATALSSDRGYDTLLRLAALYREDKRYDDSRALLERARALEPEWPYAYVALAEWHSATGKLDEAVECYQRAITLAPSFHDAYWGLCSLLESRNEWERVLRWYEQSPRSPAYLVRYADAKRGDMFTQLGMLSDAACVGRELLQRDSGDAGGRAVIERVADAYVRQGNVSEARRLHDELLAMLPPKMRKEYLPRYCNRLGNISFDEGEYEQAAAQYLHAVEHSHGGDKAAYARNLAGAYRQLQRFAEAEEQLRNALSIDRDERAFNDSLALLINSQGNQAFSAGDYTRAAASYRQAATLNDAKAVFHGNLGLALTHLAEAASDSTLLQQALDAVRKAAALDPQDYATRLAELERRSLIAANYGNAAAFRLPIVNPISVVVADDLIPCFEGELGGLSEPAREDVNALRTELRTRYGVELPGLRIRGSGSELPHGTYIVLLDEVPATSGVVPASSHFSPDVETLEQHQIPFSAASNPRDGSPGAWVADDSVATAEAAGATFWNARRYALAHVYAVLRDNLDRFLNHQYLANLVHNQLGESVYSSLLAASEKLTALTIVCRSLVAEQVPITRFADLYALFERLMAEGRSLRTIAEHVRVAPWVREGLRGNCARCAHFVLGPHLEDAVRCSIARRGNEAVLAIEPETYQRLLAAVRDAVGDSRDAVIVVSDAELRPFVRLLLMADLPHVPVLAVRELDRTIALDSKQRIEIDVVSQPGSLQRETSAAPSSVSCAAVSETEQQVSVRVSLGAAFGAEAASDEPTLAQQLATMQDELFQELGVIVPNAEVEFDTALDQNEFRFEINGKRGDAIRGLAQDEYLVHETPDRLRLLNIEGRLLAHPASGSECTVASKKQAPPSVCESAGLRTWSARGFVVLALSAALRGRAPELQSTFLTSYMLDRLGESFPILVDTALKRFSLPHLKNVFHELLSYDISIHDMVRILESLLAIRGSMSVDTERFIVLVPLTDSLCLTSNNEASLTVTDQCEVVRAALRRQISHKYSHGSSTVVAYLLDSKIEQRIVASAREPLTSEERSRLANGLRAELEWLPRNTSIPVVLTSSGVAKPLRPVLRAELPQVAVLSYQELSPNLNLQPIARISWT